MVVADSLTTYPTPVQIESDGGRDSNVKVSPLVAMAAAVDSVQLKCG
jgi:hypothetical protein